MIACDWIVCFLYFLSKNNNISTALSYTFYWKHDKRLSSECIHNQLYGFIEIVCATLEKECRTRNRQMFVYNLHFTTLAIRIEYLCVVHVLRTIQMNSTIYAKCCCCCIFCQCSMLVCFRTVLFLFFLCRIFLSMPLNCNSYCKVLFALCECVAWMMFTRMKCICVCVSAIFALL